MANDKPLLIGIDGNEANIASRVGVNQFAYGLIDGLAKTDTVHNFVIYLASPPLSDLPKEKANWHYRVIPPPKFWTQWRLPLDLFSHLPRPDIFFSPSHYAPRFSPIPTVVSIMDLGFLRTPEQFIKKDYFQLREWTRYSVKNTARVLAISEFTKKDVEKTYGLPSQKVSVVYPGYSPEKFYPRSASEIKSTTARHRISLPYLLFIGSLKPSKNVVKIIEAFTLVTRKKNSGQLKLVIVGKKAWLYDEIFKRVKDLGLSRRVTFTGFVPEEDKPALLSGASAFLQPSLFEGFGMPVVESYACGTPAVISRVGSLSEAGGECAFYVDPNDAASIARGISQALALNSHQLSNLRTKQLKYITKFSWQKSAKETLALLEDVVLPKHSHHE